MEKMKQECKVKKPLKIWQGVLTLLVSAVILFVAAPILLSPFGMYGSLLGELLLFGVAAGAVLLFHGDLREVFPLKKPHFSGIAGTILIWVGTFLCEMVLLLILSLFFPDQILEVNDGLSSSIAAGPFLLSFVTVAISPAICEEALFRGTFVSSLRGRLGKWAVPDSRQRMRSPCSSHPPHGRWMGPGKNPAEAGCEKFLLAYRILLYKISPFSSL